MSLCESKRMRLSAEPLLPFLHEQGRSSRSWSNTHLKERHPRVYTYSFYPSYIRVSKMPVQSLSTLARRCSVRNPEHIPELRQVGHGEEIGASSDHLPGTDCPKWETQSHSTNELQRRVLQAVRRMGFRTSQAGTPESWGPRHLHRIFFYKCPLYPKPGTASVTEPFCETHICSCAGFHHNHERHAVINRHRRLGG